MGLSKLASALCLGLAVVRSHALPSARPKLLTRGDEVEDTYDYVIVGGGTAGLTVADRLTEDGQYSVLVIELGQFENNTFVTTVSKGFMGILDPSLNFNFTSAPQVGLNNRTANVVGGVMLGGSSGINGMQVHRGQREDYDRWASYFPGPSSWGWSSILPYFKKAWNFHPPLPSLVGEFDINYDTSYWGSTSNIHANWPTMHWPVLKDEMAAIGEIDGVEYPPDSGAGLPGAFWYPASSTPDVIRSFARNGHWDGIESQRSNYETIVNHRVLKVEFQGRRAKRVVFVPASAQDASGASIVCARKEIIIAAGTIHTPQILQASGIGPRDVLEAAGIPVKVHLPGVGANFQDHPYQVGAAFSLTNYSYHPDANDPLMNQTFIAEAEAEFAANRTGPYTIASGNAGAFLPFPVIAPDVFQDIADRYEAQDAADFLPPGTHHTVVAGYQAQKAALAAALRSHGSAFYNFFFLGSNDERAVILLHPLSRGTISVNPNDPYFSQPIVDYRALSNPIDIEILIEFTRFTRKLWHETSLSVFDPVELWPGENLTSAADLEAAIRDYMVPTSFHAVGTAAMMPRRLGGVVDQDLTVYGVRGLSVVDASVMPDLPGAYTQQTTYAIAEKAADLIKARA